MNDQGAHDMDRGDDRLEPVRALPRCIGRRVDALTIAYQVDLGQSLPTIRSRSDVARDAGGGAELAIGAFVGRLRAPRTVGAERWPIDNADLRGMIEPRASGGWNLELTFRAVYLATHTLEQVCELAETTARSFGAVRACRVRRVDLCADLVGFALSLEDSRGFVIPRKARMTTYQPLRDADARFAPYDDDRVVMPQTQTYQNAAAEITGFTICPSGDLRCDVYVKTEELSRKGDEQKIEIEHRIWREAGWDASEPVVRVEFNLRGTALDDMARRQLPSGEWVSPLRRPTTIADELDAVWAYLTSREANGPGGWSGLTWLRLCLPETSTRRSRCELDPRWSVVQAVTFRHASQACRRTRRRGGAGWAQTWGAMLSSLASEGNLGRVNIEQGQESIRAVYAATTGQPELARAELARASGLALILDLCMTAGVHMHRAFFAGTTDRLPSQRERDASDELGVPMQRRPLEVTIELAEKVNAAWSRFRSADDGWGMPAHYEVTPTADGWSLRLVGSSGVPPPLPDSGDQAERAALEALGDA